MERVPGTSAADSETPHFTWALRSHPGCLRDGNEDFVGAYAPAEAQERGPLFVVADGMGGHAAGEVASRMAVESVLVSWTTGSGGQPKQALRAAVRQANSSVFGASLDRENRGMGTTMVTLALAGSEAYVGHVGDSRAYQIRGQNCRQLTADHSRVGEMLRMNLITPEQAAVHPSRSMLTRSLGGEPAVQVDINKIDVSQGDAFMLCSDGVWDLVSSAEIARIVGEMDSAEAAEALIDLAIERGAPDNVTVIVVHMTGRLPEQPAAPRRSLRQLLGFGWQ